jgi:hypothetical protein
MPPGPPLVVVVQPAWRVALGAGPRLPLVHVQVHSPNQIASATSPRGLVADSSNVYWIDGSGATIMRVALSGGQATTLATGQSATAIAQDGSSVYWTNANAIMRMPK